MGKNNTMLIAAAVGIPVLAFLFDVFGIRTSLGCTYFQCNDPLGNFLNFRPTPQGKVEAGRARRL
jgi:hypothetical protein